MTLVIDASVIVKWLLADPDREAETERATQMIEHVVEGREPVVQPVHWLAEVGAVLARLSPASARDDLAMLQALELPVADDPDVMDRACLLAMELRRHLFETLYHAVALETPDASLVTADERYFRAARRQGRLMRLSDWSGSR